MPRHAIYFAPPANSRLWQFGSGVIGYDAATGQDVPLLMARSSDPAAWSAITGEPRRYGFHATLKAPFEAADGMSETRLLDDVAALADRLLPVPLPVLRVSVIGRFIALTPEAVTGALGDLAATVVEELDHLRAPLGAADRARRLKAALTSRQVAYLDRYGYPYVREEFRFHMTLTGPLDEPERAGVQARLAEAYAEVAKAAPVAVDALTVFKQATRNSRFRIIARLPLSRRPTA